MTAKGRYEKLKGTRREYLERGRAAAELTLPYILTREGHTSTEDLPTPYQSVGARGVNNLAAKMLMSLFPVNQPVFRMTVDDATLEELAGQEGQRALVEEALNRIERITTAQIEGLAYRPSLYEVMRQLIIVGNVLVYVNPKTGRLRVHPLTRYVCKRDADGSLIELIIKECVTFSALPLATQEQLASSPDAKAEIKEEDELDLYTHVKMVNGKYVVYQEVEGEQVEGSDGVFTADRLPYICIRFNRVDGEDYGRGYVEEFIGDLISAEGLSQAILEGAAGAARLLFLVNPNGTTDKEDLANAPNGEFVDGTATDVQALQVQKGADMRVAMEQNRDLLERLAFAFLLNSAVQRTGERVTAEEIRFMAQELESALGGIYSILSQELQLPLVTLVMSHLQKKGKLPNLPKDTVQPVVVTGVEALGRGQDLQRLQQFVTAISPLPGAMQQLNIGDLTKRVGSSLGIDMKGLIKTPEEVAQEAQQAQLAQMGQNAAGPVAGQLAKAAVQGVAQDAPQ